MEGVGIEAHGNVDPIALPKEDEKSRDDRSGGDWNGRVSPCSVNLILFLKDHFLAGFNHILPAFNFSELFIYFLFKTFQLFAVKFLLGK